jgi:hypothetical protein
VTDRFEPFAAYCAARLGEDPHVWATTLFDELLELGYDRRIRRSPGRCGRGVCGRTANRADPRRTGSWVPNYRDLGRTDLTAAELRRRHTVWTHQLVRRRQT